jgi:WD40 repeat protein
MQTLVGHTSRVTDVTFSADDRYLSSTSEDGSVRVWHANSGEECSVYAGDHGVGLSSSFSPHGDSLAVGFADGTVIVCDPRTGNEMVQLIAGEDPVLDLKFSPDGTKLAGVIRREDGSGQILVWLAPN